MTTWQTGKIGKWKSVKPRERYDSQSLNGVIFKSSNTLINLYLRNLYTQKEKEQ